MSNRLDQYAGPQIELVGTVSRVNPMQNPRRDMDNGGKIVGVNKIVQFDVEPKNEMQRVKANGETYKVPVGFRYNVRETDSPSLHAVAQDLKIGDEVRVLAYMYPQSGQLITGQEGRPRPFAGCELVAHTIEVTGRLES